MDAVEALVSVARWIGPSGAVEADDVAALAGCPDVCVIGTCDAKKGGRDTAGLSAPVGAIKKADSAARADNPDAIGGRAPDGVEGDGIGGIAVEIAPCGTAVGCAKNATLCAYGDNGVVVVGCPDAIEIIVDAIWGTLSNPRGAVPFDNCGSGADGPDV